MDQVEVEITGQAITAQYGTLETGTILRTSPEYAAHLVNEAHCAKYTKAKAASVEKEAAPHKATRGAKAGKASKVDAEAAGESKPDLEADHAASVDEPVEGDDSAAPESGAMAA